MKPLDSKPTTASIAPSCVIRSAKRSTIILKASGCRNNDIVSLCVSIFNFLSSNHSKYWNCYIPEGYARLGKVWININVVYQEIDLFLLFFCHFVLLVHFFFFMFRLNRLNMLTKKYANCSIQINF